MIISHKYKFLFIGLPFSASSAITKDLHAKYEGEPYLRKHSLYMIVLTFFYNKLIALLVKKNLKIGFQSETLIRSYCVQQIFVNQINFCVFYSFSN